MEKLRISTRNISKIKFVQLLFLLAGYTAAKEFFFEDNLEIFLLFKFLLWFGILYIFGVISVIYFDILKDIRETQLNKQQINIRLLILIFWILAASSIRNVGWTSENLSGSFIIFLSFVPIVWLFKVKGGTLVKIGLLFLLFSGVSLTDHELTGTVFAELAYLWFGTAVLIRLNNLYEKRT